MLSGRHRGRSAHSLISAMNEPNKAIGEAKRQSATVKAMRSEIEQAVQLLQRGDDAGLEQALALLQNTVFSFSMRVCGQREDAEDTMQEVFGSWHAVLGRVGARRRH